MHPVPSSRFHLSMVFAVTLLLIALPLFSLQLGPTADDQVRGDLARLVREAHQDPLLLERPDGLPRLKTLIERLLPDLNAAPEDQVLSTIETVEFLALHARHRTTARPLFDRIFRQAWNQLVPYTDAPAANKDKLATAARQAVARIDAFWNVSKASPSACLSFPLRPDKATVAAAVPPGASGPVSVVIAGPAELTALTDRKRADRVAALIATAFPGNGPTQVEIVSRDANLVDLNILLYNWTPPFRWAGFGPLTSIAARFLFRGIPGNLLEESGFSTSAVFTSNRLESFTVVFEASHLRNVAAGADTKNPMEVALALPGENLQVKMPDAATIVSSRERFENDFGFRILNPQTAEQDGFLTLANEGGEIAIKASGTTPDQKSFLAVGNAYPGNGQPGFANRLILVNGKRPGFPFSLAWDVGPTMVLNSACKHFRSYLVFYPWVEDLFCCEAPDGNRLVVMTGRGIQPQDKLVEEAK